MNLLPFRVYQILSEHTDGDHALAMGELLRLLRTEYGLRCDRRAAYAALDKLRAVGCHIPEYQDDGEGYRLLSRPLEQSEVRLLSNAVSAFPGISQRQCEQLLEKLRCGLSRWQREQCRPLVAGTPWRSRNHETFLSVEVLEEAVSRRCQVEFQYMEYGMDKRLHPRRERPYRVSPYGLCFANGNYYLICRYQGAEDISHYRMDRIQSLVSSRCRPGWTWHGMSGSGCTPFPVSRFGRCCFVSVICSAMCWTASAWKPIFGTMGTGPLMQQCLPEPLG